MRGDRHGQPESDAFYVSDVSRFEAGKSGMGEIRIDGWLGNVLLHRT